MFQEPTGLTPVEPSPSPVRRRGAGPRAALVLGGCLLLVVPVVAVLGSSPASVPLAPAAGASGPPAASAPSLKGDDRGDGRDKLRGQGHGRITITAIDGSSVSLETDDGWKRTVTVTSETRLTKGGQAITLGDLAVGDVIRLKQRRGDDGAYTVTALVVSTPKVGGEVTAVSGNRITIRQRDGATQVVTVTPSTDYRLGKATGTKSDVTVGSRIAAQGTLEGSTFTALSVHIALARASGEVTATTADSITIRGRDGATIVLHVTGTTTIRVKGKPTATIADIAVGDRIKAVGTRRADGSLDASAVHGRAPKAERSVPGAVPGESAPTS